LALGKEHDGGASQSGLCRFENAIVATKDGITKIDYVFMFGGSMTNQFRYYQVDYLFRKDSLSREDAFFDVEEREEVPMRHELLFRKDLMGCASRLCRNCAKNGRFLAFSRSISQCYMLY